MNDQSSNARNDAPWQTARDLYGGTLGVRSKGAIARSQVKYGGLKPHQRETIAANLLYLEIQATEQLHVLLQTVSRDLRNLTGAVYAIAETVARGRAEADSGREGPPLSPVAEAEELDVTGELDASEEDLAEDGVDLEAVLSPVLESADGEAGQEASSIAEDVEGGADGLE